MNYNFRVVEHKWKQIWKKDSPAQTQKVGSGKKYYCLDMFPYPSGSGLHVGHWRGYVLSDVYARIKWIQGYNILHPMGWDAFGLPAENYALTMGVHPKVSTAENVARFKEQLVDICALYDWSKEINTTDPEYYRWTQWIFLEMFRAGLAYESHKTMNWCPRCKVVLANEEVVSGNCERCGALATSKKVRQWMLKITQYADKLLEGLDRLDWPEKVKLMQQNWIGKSSGAIIAFKVKDSSISLDVYTTCPETIFGVAFVVMAHDHDLVDVLVTESQKASLQEYQNLVSQKNEASIDRKNLEKNGCFSGSYVINPINNQVVPLYFSNYVLKDYGTGIVMGVPAHDERDYEFAKNSNIAFKRVIQNPLGDLEGAYIGDGVLINSGLFDGLQAKTVGRKKIINFLGQQGFGSLATRYRLRDWVFSRQRYWGEPIPLVHCVRCGVVPVPEDQLPVKLPDVERYEPTDTGESPLAAIEEWVNTVCPLCFSQAKRETNTMPNWAGSSWYFLRYPNPHLHDKPFDAKDMSYWMPVDLYVGGIEHAILHLLYARFYVKVLHQLGHISFDEPFKQLFNQGMITRLSEKSGQVEKMSKSKGNVVNPDDIVKKYGSDVMRMYILFMGPPEMDCEWQDAGLEGVKRFANRLWNYLTNPLTQLNDSFEEDLIVKKHVHRLISVFTDRIENFKPNTALAAYMEWLNEAIAKSMKLSCTSIEDLIVLFSIMAPCMASELLEILLQKQLKDCMWPTYDPLLIVQAEVTIAIQVNGKMRETIRVSVNLLQDAIEEMARKVVVKWLVDKKLIKTIYVPGKLINFVVI